MRSKRRQAAAPFWNQDVGDWCVDFAIEGHRFRRRLGLREKGLKDLAEQKARALYRAEWQRHLAPPEPVLEPYFFEAATSYIQSGGEARFLPKLMEHFGAETRIDAIGEPEIIAAAQTIYPTASPDTHRRQVRVPISAVIRHARGQTRQPSTDKARVDWLTPEQAERLLDAAARLTLPRHNAPERYTLAKIACLLGSGCRTGECFAAEVKDWNAATRQLWIPAEATGAGKTALAARWVRLPQRSVELIGEVPEEGRMFRTPYGQPIVMRKNGGGQMAAAFNKARDAAGLPATITPHVLRHTWATWFYSQTRDYGELLDQGGWAKADTAERYRKLAPADLGDRLLAHGWDFRNTPPPDRVRLETVA